MQFLGSLELGLIYGLVALAVYLSFRVIKFSDMTVDGSFPLGAAVTAVLLVKGTSPILSTLLAMAAGALAGLVTGVIHLKLKVDDLLASILTMIALYSINLRIMQKPNVALLEEVTLFGDMAQANHQILWKVGGIVGIICVLLGLFLITRFGLSMIAVGVNPTFSRAYGIHVSRMTLLGLALSNAISALAGSIFSQVNGFADISLGTGTIVSGLAAVFIGESLLSSSKTGVQILGCILGAIIYRFAISLALEMDGLGLQSSDINLITSSVVAIALGISRTHLKAFRFPERPRKDPFRDQN